MASSQKMNALTSTDSDFSVDMNIESSGTSLTTRSTGNAKAILNGSDTKYLVHTNSQVQGKTVDSDCYYSDGYVYVSSSGQKVKEKMDLSSFLSEEQSQSLLTNNYPENDFDSASVSTYDGDTIIDATIPAQDAQKIADSAAKNYLSKLGIAQSINFQYSDINFELIVGSDGYVKSSNAKFTITMSLANSTQPNVSNSSNAETKMSMTISNTYNNPGQAVTITPPSDLSSYKETAAASSLA